MATNSQRLTPDFYAMPEIVDIYPSIATHLGITIPEQVARHLDGTPSMRRGDDEAGGVAACSGLQADVHLLSHSGQTLPSFTPVAAAEHVVHARSDLGAALRTRVGVSARPRVRAKRKSLVGLLDLNGISRSVLSTP